MSPFFSIRNAEVVPFLLIFIFSIRNANSAKNTWPNGVVPYVFDKNVDSSSRRKIQNALALLMKSVCHSLGGLCRHITGSFRILNNGQYRVMTVFTCLAVTKTILENRTRRKQVAQGQYMVSDTRCPALHGCKLE